MKKENNLSQPEIHPFGFDHIIDIKQQVFDNGVAINLIPLEDTRIVMVDFFFHGCKWHQSRCLQAYFSSVLLCASTTEHDAETLAKIIDNNGASIYGRTGYWGTSITLLCLSKNLRTMMEVMKSVLTHPTFDQKRFSNAVSTMKQNLAINLQDVNSVCFDEFLNALYGKSHPTTSWAQLDDYDTLTREDLLAFHEQFICSSDCQIWMTGNITDEAVDLVNGYFGKSSWGKGNFVYQDPVWPEINPSPEQTILKKMDGVQSAILTGKLLPRWDHPDFTKIMVATTLLGGYFGSRLMTNIREEKGLTYSIYASLRQTLCETALMITTATANETAARVIEEIRKEIQRMRTERVGDDELERAKNYMIGYACRKHEAGLGLSKMLMTTSMKGRPYDYIVTENRLVRDTSADDVLDIANRYFDPDTMKLCVVGNASL